MNDKEQISSKVTLDETPYIHFDLTFRLTTFVLLLSLPYLVWEIYWANKVGYAFIKWHTHLALYFYSWQICMFLLRVLNNKFNIKNYIQYQIVITAISFVLLLSEIALIVLGIGDTYMEKINFGYASRYSSSHEQYYRTHLPFEKTTITRPEFSYPRQSNSLGFSDIEWKKGKAKNEKRILIAGDSFTEGVGAPFDSCYVSLLRSLLLKEDTSYYLMNTGISGDDPCVNFVNYRDRLIQYHPDIIIQTLSSNDLNTDMATKGGLERFQKDKAIKFLPAPWWEPIYAISYVSRIFFSAFGYNELLIKSSFTQKEKKMLDEKACQLFTAYSKEAKRYKTKLLVILQPNQREVYQRGYEYDLSFITKQFSLQDNLYVFDLLPYYLKELDKSKGDIKSYYWKEDGHHNSKGYFLMAKGVQQALDSFNLK